ncbi:hypothetical protein DFP72DRAFT_1169486 [Ephemerocybe angulata]|uniref:FAD/NAD(P)-binding domain-containing protein n=1 Tax=Ephemerocybe angulata TaxID=980116 RepID=A0A8H6HYP1_9AGAR|nr:hypothetical protein DFP72DRAFT_1169486 [Tulosesus angulatus]
MATIRNIVILGGGTFGITAARKIAAKVDTTRYKVIVVTPRPYYVHLPGLIRTLVTSDGALEKQIFMPYGSTLNGKGDVVVANAVSFTETKEGGEISLSNGECISYSGLVLAPGTKWEGALSLPDEPSAILEHIKSWREKIRNAASILLVGGGAVGVEFAGELKDYFPSKPVSLTHAHAQLLNDAYPDKYRSALLARLGKTGTEIILNDYVDVTEPSKDGTITTRSGKTIHADLIIPTRGGRPNTDVVSKSLGADSLTESGHIKVLPTLQLPDHPRIFAAGDAINWKEQKQAGKADGHAAVVAENVLTVLNGGEPSATYKGSPEIIIASVGRTGGASYLGVLWGPVFGDAVSSRIKSRGLLIEIIRQKLGLGRLE